MLRLGSSLLGSCHFIYCYCVTFPMIKFLEPHFCMAEADFTEPLKSRKRTFILCVFFQPVIDMSFK